MYVQVAHGEDRHGEYVERELTSRLSLGLGSHFSERLAGLPAAYEAAAAADAGGAEGSGIADAVATPAIFLATRQCVGARDGSQLFD